MNWNTDTPQPATPLPCPFCGAKMAWFEYDCGAQFPGYCLHLVHLDKCGAFDHEADCAGNMFDFSFKVCTSADSEFAKNYDNRESAESKMIAAWNRRAPDTALIRERDELREGLGEAKEALSYVERMANHHGAKGLLTAEQTLSLIQHHPPIEAITKSYSDGKIPETPNPYAELAALKVLIERSDLVEVKAMKRGIGASYVPDGKILQTRDYMARVEQITKEMQAHANTARQLADAKAKLDEAMRLLDALLRASDALYITHPAESPKVSEALDSFRAFLANTPTAGNQ